MGFFRLCRSSKLDPRTFRRPSAHAVLQPLVVARLPGRHEHRVVAGLGGVGLGKHELGLVVAAAALVPQPRGLEDQVGELQHVPELVHVRGALVHGAAGVEDVAALPALLVPLDLDEGGVDLRVHLHHGGRLHHRLAHLLADDEGILGPVHLVDGAEPLVPDLLRPGEQGCGTSPFRLHVVLRVADHRRPGDHPRVDAGEQRVGAEPIRAMIGVVALARGVQSGDVRHLLRGLPGTRPFFASAS